MKSVYVRVTAMFSIASLLLTLLLVTKTATAFQPARNFQTVNSRQTGSHQQQQQQLERGYYDYGHWNARFESHPSARCDRSVRLSAGILDEMRGFLKRFTTKASASHILIKGGAEAANKLEDLKVEIGDSPVRFAAAASSYSECPSSSRGGDLGSFGPGAMVKEFDEVVFQKDIGVVHGPVRTQFGYHLIYIRDRTE